MGQFFFGSGSCNFGSSFGSRGVNQLANHRKRVVNCLNFKKTSRIVSGLSLMPKIAKENNINLDKQKTQATRKSSMLIVSPCHKHDFSDIATVMINKIFRATFIIAPYKKTSLYQNFSW